MRKKKVYVESSVISYLTARPARVLEKLVKQQQTADWWDIRHRWELFISPAVVAEIQDGDRGAAQKRLDAVDGVSILDSTKEMDALAKRLMQEGVLPGKSSFDALHIATATLSGMDYLATWNQKHIFNLDRIESLYAAIRRLGHTPPVLVRPDYFLETSHGE